MTTTTTTTKETMTMTKRTAPKKNTRTTMAQAGLDPVSAAKQRIATCQRLGMPVDPADEQIVADGS